MKSIFKIIVTLFFGFAVSGIMAAEPPLKLGVGLFSPTRKKTTPPIAR